MKGVNLQLVWRRTFTLAAVGSIVAASLVAFIWQHSRQAPIQFGHDWSSADGLRYTEDSFVVERGTFGRQRYDYWPAISYPGLYHRGPIGLDSRASRGGANAKGAFYHFVDGYWVLSPPDPPNPFPPNQNHWHRGVTMYAYGGRGTPEPLHGFECLYSAGNPIAARVEYVTKIAFPLWLPLIIFLIVPLAWVRWWLHWRKADPHTKTGFEPVVAQHPRHSGGETTPGLANQIK
jgi:hypothetical protein